MKQHETAEEAHIRKLIRETALAIGDVEPATLPHAIRQKLHGQLTGSMDTDAYIQKLLAEMKKR